MRYYNPDGTYHDHPKDNEFGWFFDDIIIDEATTSFQEQNENNKEISRLNRSLIAGCSKDCIFDSCRSSIEDNSDGDDAPGDSSEAEAPNYANDVDTPEDLNDVEESIDVLEDEHPEPAMIHKIKVNVKEETPTNSIISQNNVEGLIKNPESNFLKRVKNCDIPTKEDMMSLINPVNPETKALLSVISYSRYRGLTERKTNEDVLKTINFRTTNSKRLINEKDGIASPFGNGQSNFLLNNNTFPSINFVINDGDIDVDSDKELASEIQNYHATKEDNMLSLMMELINTDMDSNLGDVPDLNFSTNEFSNTGVTETSDLGNSIHSSILSSIFSKEGNGVRERGEKRHCLDIPNRSSILSSIGLSDDIDRSIECFTQEKIEMHQQLIDIKKSFEDDEKKLDSLIDQAVSLQNDLRETTYLTNLIHMLNGHPEKVKRNQKLPFRMFFRSNDEEEANENMII